MKQVKQVSALLSGLLITSYVQAASQFPTTLAATLTTDMTDTYDEMMTWTYGIFAVVAIGWFAFNQTRKGAGKFGAK